MQETAKMADQSVQGDAAKPAAGQWSRSKATAMLGAAWLALCLLSMLVTIVAYSVAGRLLADSADPNSGMLQALMSVVLISIFGSLLFVFGGGQPDPERGRDQFVSVTPPQLLTGVAIMAACSTIVLVLVFRVHPLVALMAWHTIALGRLVIDGRLALLIRHHAPYLWAEALDRRQRQKAAEEWLLQATTKATLAVLPALMILFMIARSVLGS